MGGKVLIVDDVATNRIVMKVKLTAAGYLPVVAADGATCLALAQTELPDLILLDLVLPDMPGTDVLAQLRANPATQGIPVVMFSASQSAEARVAAFRAGADDFLVKPLDDQTMLARIRSLLRAREAVAGFDHGAGTLPTFGLATPGLAEDAAAFHPPATVALVMQRPETAMLLRRALTGKSQATVVTLTPDEALAGAGITSRSTMQATAICRHIVSATAAPRWPSAAPT